MKKEETTAREARAVSFEQAAVLFASGVQFIRAENGGRRVALIFDDAGGKASALLERHERAGIATNSLAFSSGLARAKQLVFSVKDCG